MNKKWLWAVGLVIALVIPVVALSGCDTGAGTISGTSSPVAINLNSQQEGIVVSGEGKVTVTPDIANVSLGIEARAATVTEAQNQAASAMTKIMDTLSGNGVAKKDIRTQYFNISKVTRWDDKTQQEVVLGYQVTNSVTAKIRNIEKTGTIIDAVVVAGGDLTRINSIYFSVDDPTQYEKEARDNAMADAKNKAEQLATLAGVRLGKPTYISENLYLPSPIFKGAAMEAVAAPTTPISPGETDITLTVQVTYAILN